MVIEYQSDRIVFSTDCEQNGEFWDIQRLGKFFVSPREAYYINEINNDRFEWYILHTELKAYLDSAKKAEINSAITKHFDTFKVKVILASLK